MNKNYFALLGFSLLFFVVLGMGCSFLNRDGGGTNVNATSGEVIKGPINATVLVNGRPAANMNLISQQNAQIGVNLQNTGNIPMYNVSAMIIGCLNVSKPLHFEDSLGPKEKRYFNWDVKALQLGSSERLTCPETIRLCFDSVSTAYADLVLVPETYQDAPAIPGTSYSSNVVATTFNLGVIRVLASELENEFSGSIRINNIGPGWVGYINYTMFNQNLSLNMIRHLTIQTTNPNITFSKIAELSTSNSEANTIGINPGLVTMDANNIKIGENNYGYLLKLTGGKELYLKVSLKILNPADYQTAPKIERVNVSLNHGYCIDIATLNVAMSGR